MTPAYYAAHREEQQAKQRAYYWANAERLRERKRIYAKEHRAVHRDRLNAQARARKIANPGAVRASQFKSRLKLRYGLSVEEYRDLLVGQAGRCLICLRADRELVVDHDHKTGRVRGLLCQPCNTALGLLDDDRKRAAQAARFLG